MSRKQISLTDPVEERAKSIINRRGFNGLSDMIATLVREEYERRGLAPASLKDAPASSTPAQQEAEAPIVAAVKKEVSYRKPNKSSK
jgi:hypothetical protein